MFDKYRLKVIDYICFLINKLLFLEDRKSEILNTYQRLLISMNNNSNYMIDLIQLELEILKSSGYQPDLTESVLSKIFKNQKKINLVRNEEIIFSLDSNVELQFLFFDFLGRVILRVLINLHIHLPFSRNDTVKRD